VGHPVVSTTTELPTEI